jgi:hypothetical protein
MNSLSRETQEIVDAFKEHFAGAEIIPRNHDVIFTLPEDLNSDFEFQFMIGDIANPAVIIKLKSNPKWVLVEEVLFQHVVGPKELDEFFKWFDDIKAGPSRLVLSHGLFFSGLSFETKNGDMWQGEISQSWLSFNPFNIFRRRKVLGVTPKHP